MAYLEAQTQHLTDCNGVTHQNFREFVKCQISNSKSRAHGIEGAGVKLESTGANLEPLD
ncbi:uncharacterized protein G2W53_028891 [Senna tora]|uniref:Uncharacterized protein n=1 Tax=Senna tora TaxID=362788 RepID=A0A834T6Q0_9FABA|nr:uncharacterized protein G2W53_028891 [Senna tora]